jgi:PPOX class probable F420-dependent enzyme
VTLLEERDRRLLQGVYHAQFVTLNADGTPHITPVWVDADNEGNVVVNTAVGRQKERNVARDPRVAISVYAVEDPLTYVSISGSVIERIEEPRALAHMDSLSRRYDGKPWTPVDGQRRVMLLIRPEHVLRGG